MNEDVFKKQQPLSVLNALKKAQAYCAYQERSHWEARQKLRGWQLPDEQIEWIISELIGENFLNELRYAKCFAEGKFRIKGWGKQKIKNALRSKKVSDYCINKALEGIVEGYGEMLQKQAEKWLHTHVHTTQQQQKLITHLLTKGYEYNEIMRYLTKQ